MTLSKMTAGVTWTTITTANNDHLAKASSQSCENTTERRLSWDNLTTVNDPLRHLQHLSQDSLLSNTGTGYGPIGAFSPTSVAFEHSIADMTQPWARRFYVDEEELEADLKRRIGDGEVLSKSHIQDAH